MITIVREACSLFDDLKIQTMLGIENRKRSGSPIMDNSVSSNGFPGSFAGSVPVVTNSTPPPATETVPRPSPRQRLLAALAGLLPRNLPASNPPSGRTNSSSSYKGASRALGVTAILALLATGLLFLLPGGPPPWAQDADTIEYAENGTGPVATYTAVDPEGAAVKWSLAVVGDPVEDDAGDFSISGGVLSFKKSPDYETPKGGGATGPPSNTYSVTVVATDATRRAGSKVVTVNVTNVDEPGTVKLTTLAPRAGIALTASVSDPDGPAPVTGPVWQWAKSLNGTSGWGDIDKATLSTYTPADGDAGSYLRATVTYKDRESVRDTKTAVGVSANAVKAARSDNDAPEFTDEDDSVEGNQATREVAENTAAGEAIGDPIVAEDDDGDVLTYTLYDDDTNVWPLGFVRH